MGTFGTKIRRAVPLVLAAVMLLSCARHRIIPDDELAQIIHDAFLTNAYLTNERITPDSLRLYEPIFTRYGYTTEDVYYTVGNFSKRKSARLGDVVERAIDQLEAEGRAYGREVAILDTIDHAAQRLSRRAVLRDSVVRVGTLRDTTQLNFTVAVEPGRYEVALRYRIDSLDRNDEGIRARMWLEDSTGTQTKVFVTTLRRLQEERLTRQFEADTMHRRLRIALLNFNARPQRPSITVRDLKVEYIPPLDRAVEELYARQLPIRIFADEFLPDIAPTDREP